MSSTSPQDLEMLYAESMLKYQFLPQLLKYAEECNEVSAAILKLQSYREYHSNQGDLLTPHVVAKIGELWESIYEEMVDVKLMQGQMEYTLNDRMLLWLKKKVTRAWERLSQ